MKTEAVARSKMEGGMEAERSRALVRARTTVGDFELTICTDGTYLLDGGAMFGVVPKPLWQKRMPADDQNRILLGLNTAVIRTGKHTVVVETGIGNKQSPKMREIHGNQELLPASLAVAGVWIDEVDVVINTHLHFDHCGWNTTLQPNGSVLPTFPNARYFAHRGEVEHGHLQLDRDKVSYLSPNYDPLVRSGQMTLLDGDDIRRGRDCAGDQGRGVSGAYRADDGGTYRVYESRRSGPACVLYLGPDSYYGASGSDLGNGI